jgi:uncharacterized repeat protein (TIGR04076 family)
MDTLRIPFRQVILGAVLIAAIPVTVFHVDHRLYAQAAYVLAAALVGTVLFVKEWRRQPAVSPAIERVDQVLGPVRPVTLRVLSAQGGCPLGFQPGHIWSLDAQGQIVPALCQGAIREIIPLLQIPANRDSLEQQVACRCPLQGRELVFGIRPVSQVA